MSDFSGGTKRPDESPVSDRRCAVTIEGRPGVRDGRLRCIFVSDHKIPHRFMAPDATLRWWPVELGEPPAWDDAISTPASDPRWPDDERLSDALVAIFEAIAEREDKTVEQVIEEFFSGYMEGASDG